MNIKIDNELLKHLNNLQQHFKILEEKQWSYSGNKKKNHLLKFKHLYIIILLNLVYYNLTRYVIKI